MSPAVPEKVPILQLILVLSRLPPDLIVLFASILSPLYPESQIQFPKGTRHLALIGK